jgi:hypothetical protein
MTWLGGFFTQTSHISTTLLSLRLIYNLLSIILISYVIVPARVVK